MAGNPKVSFVLVNLNQEALTRACIRSLRDLTYPDVEILLVDNCSTDGSGSRLAAEFPEVVFIPSGVNLGFAEGNNLGIRGALERQADYVVLLNNDTIVDPPMVEPLLEAARKDASIGVQSCKIYFAAERDTLWYAGGVLQVARATGLHPAMHSKDRGQYNVFGDTGFATGCMMFVSRTALESVGLLDKRYFIYLEDADWCVRARRAGFRVIYNPASRLWHSVSVTTRIDSTFYLYFTCRNKLLFVRKHCPVYLLPLSFAYLTFFYLRQIIRLLVKWRSPLRARAVWWGIVDGLRGRTGAYGEGRLHLLSRT